jgi:hypothetical protein
MLPAIRKQILYLDQHFLSHAFRQSEAPFVAAAGRIAELAARQLLVCPWSSFHELETHVWRHDQQQALWKFIKQTARGHDFELDVTIKERQIVRSFRRFLGDNSAPALDPEDALDVEAHEWDNYIWIDAGRFMDDAERLRAARRNSATDLVGLFDAWAQSPATFAEDVAEEARSYGKSLLELYSKAQAALLSGAMVEYLYAPAEGDVVAALLHVDEETLGFEQRAARVAVFLASAELARTPFVDASSRLFAVLRKRVRGGSFKNREKAVDKLGGLFCDIEVASVYAPYCDAVFLDREMRRWVADDDCDLPTRYGFRAFSAECWDDFNSYLDGIAASETEEHSHWVRAVYA